MGLKRNVCYANKDDVNLIKAHHQSGFSSFGSNPGPQWKNITLTWQGNDFLDAIGDDKAWKKIKKGLTSGAKLATIEALKQVAKGAGAAGLAIILAENNDQVKGIAEPNIVADGGK